MTAEQDPASLRAGLSEQTISGINQAYLQSLFSVAALRQEEPGEKELAWLRARRETLAKDPESLQSLVPRLPSIMPRLMSAVNNPESTNARQLAGMIETDPVIATTVLRVVNSPAMRVRREDIDSLEQAIMVLGFAGMREAIAAAVVSPIARFDRDARLNSRGIQQLWPVSLHAAVGAREGCQRFAAERAFDAYMAALVHNSGLIALLRSLKALDCARLSPTLLTEMDALARHYTLAIATSWGLSAATLAMLNDWAEGRSASREQAMFRDLIVFMRANALHAIGQIDKARLRGLWRQLPDYADGWFEECTARSGTSGAA
ncbi:MAG: HDOD domain-containing protein [Halothiobacillaceae bacterium]